MSSVYDWLKNGIAHTTVKADTRDSMSVQKVLQVVRLVTTTSQQISVVFAPDYPCTLMGIRWDGLMHSASAGAQAAYWALVRVRSGYSQSTISITDSTALYEPEEDVLAFGVAYTPDSDQVGDSYPIRGVSKARRRLMPGDTIVFCIRGVNTVNGSTLHLPIQLFAKINSTA